MPSFRRFALGSLLAVPLLAPAAFAQDAGSVPLPTDRMASRAELEASALLFDRLAASPAYGESSRNRARSRAVAARRRLTEGDFRVGDRILLTTGGTVTLDDTVTVLDGQRLAVPSYGTVSVAGVLRSELEARLMTQLTVFVRSTTLTARPLMRVAVFGAVAAPGYLSVPQETTLDQVVMRAGGPVVTAGPRRMTVLRADTVLMKSDALLAAVADGRTLAALGIEDGDVINVPTQRPPWDRASTLQIATLFLTPLLTLFVFNR